RLAQRHLAPDRRRRAGRVDPDAARDRCLLWRGADRRRGDRHVSGRGERGGAHGFGGCPARAEPCSSWALRRALRDLSRRRPATGRHQPPARRSRELVMRRACGSPRRYVQGPGALEQLGALAAEYGSRPFIVADDNVLGLLRPRIEASLGALSAHAEFGTFDGECTVAEITRLGAKARTAGADVVIGVGGGKAIDTAKGVRVGHDVPLLIVPTVASNDSPTSRLVVTYTADHVLDEVRTMHANPDVVLVDTEVLVRAPERFFVSGVGDAVSKKFEAAQCIATGNDNFYGARPPRLAQVIADACYEIIRADAELALVAVRAQAADEAFERTIEATILLSGLAFENGGLAIAHSLTRGFSVVAGVADALHGEQVAFGPLAQLVL